MTKRLFLSLASFAIYVWLGTWMGDLLSLTWKWGFALVLLSTLYIINYVRGGLYES